MKLVAIMITILGLYIFWHPDEVMTYSGDDLAIRIVCSLIVLMGCCGALFTRKEGDVK